MCLHGVLLQWLGTGELGGGFSMLEGYSEDGNQEVHPASSGPHSTQQSHQMVSVGGHFCAGQMLSSH